MENFKQKLHAVKAFVFDVDGVLTNGSLLVMNDGALLRSMNIKDGYALQHAVKNGYRVAVISGGQSDGVPLRLARLGITDVFMGAENKTAALENFISKYRLKTGEVIYMGDDVPDMEAMQRCGIACCPADAVQEIKNISSYISDSRGGEGCVRDMIEQVMRLHGKWNTH